jgi:hypothetical protein
VKVFHATVSTTIRINQAVPSLDESLQMELIIIDEACKTVTNIDVTMPFENFRKLSGWGHSDKALREVNFKLHR